MMENKKKLKLRNWKCFLIYFLKKKKNVLINMKITEI